MRVKNVRSSVSVLIIAAMATLAAQNSAVAADLQVKAPVYQKAPPIVTDTWSGFYLGGSVGGRWDTETWTTIDTHRTPYEFSSASPRAGVYGGYNWQFQQNWVIGLEGEFAWANNETSTDFVTGLERSKNGSITGTTTVKDKWDARLRGRLGFLVTPSTLLFGAAGVSWLESETDVTATSVWTKRLDCRESITKPASASDSTSGTTAGWTLGGGIETKVLPNWLLRGEYRYSSYGNRHVTLLKGAQGGALHSVDVDLGKYNTQTVLVGLAYQF
jgi:outer membrane immunogenic protein